MRKVILQLHMTLDGFVDGKTRIVPEFNTPYWKELDEALVGTGAESVDTLLLGKGTYREWAGYWPKAAEDPSESPEIRATARYFNETPKVVFSRRLPKADWQNTTIARGDLAREIGRLKRRPGKNLLVPGGVRFPRALIEKDLVDEYLLSVVPMIMGQGPYRLFGAHRRPKYLRLVRTRSFTNGAIFQYYEPIR